ncbi:type 1 glutamine amidotransferase domain-containing protein [Rathayibacter sp. KR2-224]|uniref:type 1 glutamine amidotransferase domain-containing protein n=1 Tax=Rathayibacter sp. KR2-224 TaxID=3400913 RepID=UPI003C00A0FB
MSGELNGKKVAFLATNGYEDAELTSPWQALQGAGATLTMVSPEARSIKGKNGHEQTVDASPSQVRASDFDALVMPGGVVNADHLRMDEASVGFAKGFFEEHKPVAAICHAPWTLIEAGVVDGRRMTSYRSLKTDLLNAGADWVDEEVVVDQGLVTSRTPDDLPAFNAKAIEEFGEGEHEGQTT